jgi:hypothetical protein
MNRLIAGVAAGAVGTTALNAVTYLDMAVRGRPASTVPEDLAAKLLDAAGIDVGEGKKAESRRSAIGALLGYATGLGIGGAYGLVGSRTPDAGGVGPGVLVGAGAMAASDVPITVAGLTDPREWGLAGWLSDIVPHAVYGLTTVWAFRRLTASGSR